MLPRRADSVPVEVSRPARRATLLPQRQGAARAERLLPAKQVSLLLPPAADQEHERKVSALNNAILTITIVRDVVPLSVVKGVFSGILGILNVVKSTINNQDDFQDLAEQCQKIVLVVWRATVGIPEYKMSAIMQRALTELKDSVVVIREEVEEKIKKGVIFNIVNVKINQETIEKWKNALDRFLILFNTELNIAANLKLDELMEMFREFRSTAANSNISATLANDLPPSPPIFVGRDDLVRDSVQALLECRSLSLIGPGGIGKTTIARAVLNNNAIISKFNDHRVFVRFDDMDASQVTLGTFLDRVARSFGINALANTHAMISKALSTNEVLLVLDNAETFLDAADDSGRIAEAIDGFGARANVAIMMTTRTTVLPPNVKWIRLRVPALEESAACEAFKLLYTPPIELSVLSRLLSSVDFHPLSINLLAQAAVQNEWTPEKLVAAWDRQRATLLESGNGKIQSITVTIETSLNSPSITQLGDTVRQLLQVIAFLPQGLDNTRLTEIFPTIPNIEICANILCKHSLAYIKQDYITVLAPIRLYILRKHDTTLPAVPLFRSLQTFYEAHAADDVVATKDDVNIEHVLALSLHDPKRVQYLLNLVRDFAYTLTEHKPRPLTLHKIIIPLQPDSRSLPFLQRVKRWFNIHDLDSPEICKGRCLMASAILLRCVGQTQEAEKVTDAARALFLRCGSVGRVHLAIADYTLGVMYYERGSYSTAEEMLTLASKCQVRGHVGTMNRRQMAAFVNLGLGTVAMYQGKSDTAKIVLGVLPTLKTLDPYFLVMGLHLIAYAELFQGHYESAKKYLLEASPFADRANDVELPVFTVLALGEVAQRQGNKEEAKAQRDKAHVMLKKLPESKIVYVHKATAVLAAYMTLEGDIARGRELIGPAIAHLSRPENLSLYTVSCTYAAGCIELVGGETNKARDLFRDTIDNSTALSELQFCARAQRALGEIAFIEKDFATARAKFGDAKALCDKMGIPTHCLYYDYACYTLGDSYNGWLLFLKERLPVE